MLTRKLGLLFCCLWVYDGRCVFVLKESYQRLLDYLKPTPVVVSFFLLFGDWKVWFVEEPAISLLHQAKQQRQDADDNLSFSRGKTKPKPSRTSTIGGPFYAPHRDQIGVCRIINLNWGSFIQFWISLIFGLPQKLLSVNRQNLWYSQ